MSAMRQMPLFSAEAEASAKIDELVQQRQKQRCAPECSTNKKSQVGKHLATSKGATE